MAIPLDRHPTGAPNDAQEPSCTIETAAAAGVSPRHLYESFTDLDDLQSKAFDAAAEEIGRHALDAVGRAPAELDSQLGALVRALLEHTEHQPDKAKLLLVDAFGDPRLAVRRQAMMSHFAEGFAACITTHYPGATTDQVLLASHLIVGGTAEVCTARLLDGDHTPIHQLTGNLTAAYLGIVQALLRR